MPRIDYYEWSDGRDWDDDQHPFEVHPEDADGDERQNGQLDGSRSITDRTRDLVERLGTRPPFGPPPPLM